MIAIRTLKTDDLGKTMPAVSGLESITAGKHFASFYAFDTCDVWTADGWLITAVQDDGETHHLRKGTDVVVAKIEPDASVYFKHTPKSRYMMGLN